MVKSAGSSDRGPEGSPTLDLRADSLRTNELRTAHDALAELYAERLATIIDRMPIERAILGLWADLIHEQGWGPEDRPPKIVDLGCGTGRLTPYVGSLGLRPHGVDLSPEMVRVARRDYPDGSFDIADLRRLFFSDASVSGALAWYSLMYLPPAERDLAFGEVARVIRPGGYLAMAFKQGDDSMRRGGRTLDLGVEFDIWWMSHREVASRLATAGFEIVFTASRPPDPDELQAQGYLIARRTAEVLA